MKRVKTVFVTTLRTSNIYIYIYLALFYILDKTPWIVFINSISVTSLNAENDLKRTFVEEKERD